jgi:hypothetical protein
MKRTTTARHQFIADPATLTRLAWATAYLRERLRMTPAESRPSTLIRRAVDAYVVHLERIMRLPDGHHDPTKDRDLANGLERTRLRDTSWDSDLGVTPEEASALPLRCLSEQVAEKVAERDAMRAPRLTPIEQIRRELCGRKDDDDVHHDDEHSDSDEHACR